jgi:hypothetical protein
MSIYCLVFVRSLIPHRRVNYCHFWMAIQAIIRSASPLMIKNSIHHVIWDLLLHQDGIRPEEQESNLSEVHSHHLELQIGRNKLILMT